MFGSKRWPAMLAPWCGLLAACSIGHAAAAQSDPLFKIVDASVTYQQTSSLLALSTRCGQLTEWQAYDKDRAIADYKTSKAFLEEVSPGYRVYSEFETFRLLKELNEAAVRNGDAGEASFCKAVAPALLTAYRRPNGK